MTDQEPRAADPVRRLLRRGSLNPPEPEDHRFRTLPVQRPVVLVGPMGSGKSSVGAQLSRTLGLPRFDTDELFVEVLGPVPEYFATHGEPAFRRAEAQVVGEALTFGRPIVLSLGGGSVLSATTRSLLAGGPHVVQLRVAEAEALARLRGGEGRPVLAGDPVGTWRRILAEREALYREVATWSVETTGTSVQEVAQRIADLLLQEG